jgi:aspartate/glutamate racemase
MELQIIKIRITELSRYVENERSEIFKSANNTFVSDNCYPEKLIIVSVNTNGKNLILFGGMGYMATLYYLNEILKFDLSIIKNIYCLQATKIPDRTSALIDQQAGNYKAIGQIVTKTMEYINFLKTIVYDAKIVLLCNTFHACLNQIEFDQIPFEVVRLDTQYIPTNYEKTLILCTKGAKDSKLFSSLFSEITIVELDNFDTNYLMDLIYKGIKLYNTTILSANANNILGLLNKYDKLYSFDNILFGCTEISEIIDLCELRKRIEKQKKIIDPVLLAFGKCLKLDLQNVANDL